MGNASDTSDVFVSKISKEHDILIGSIYSVFCKFAAFHRPSGRFLSCTDPTSVFFLSPCRYTVPHGQLHTAASCVSQALDAEAGWVLHRQPLHQRPGHDAHFVSSGDTVIFFTQVRGWMDVWAKAAPQLLFCPDIQTFVNITSSLFVQISLNQNREKCRNHENKKE